MTTSVQIKVPTPNHKRVRVRAFYVHEDGTEGPLFKERVLEHGEESHPHEFFVHGGMKLVVEEVD